jgi:hypothetical protein
MSKYAILQGVIVKPSSLTTCMGLQLDGEYIFVSFSMRNILQTNENNSKEYDGLEELKDVEASACAVAKTSRESKENNTHCLYSTPLFLHMSPCSRNNAYPCTDTKLSTIVGHWNKTRTTCCQEGDNDEIMHMFAA